MSRHSLEAKDKDHDVVVGWDPPLATFFVQVTSRSASTSKDEDADPMVCWEGCDSGQIPTIEHLAEVLAPYAEIPMEMRLRLAADRIANTGLPCEEKRRAEKLLADTELWADAPEARLALIQGMTPTPRDPNVLDTLGAGNLAEHFARARSER